MKLPKVYWCYGLSGSGKTTLTQGLAKELRALNFSVLVIDGDDLRSGLCKDLLFSEQDRTENVKRAAYIAKLAVQQGILVIVALMTPQKSMRELARSVVGSHQFEEIYLQCPLFVCEQRDTKGLYQLSANDGIKNLSGKDSPFEPSTEADFVIKTAEINAQQCIDQVLNFIMS